MRSDTFSYVGGAKVLWLGLEGRILQYFNFVGSCFIAPMAESIVRYDKWTWFLVDIYYLNFVGLIIFCLTILSVVINFRDKLCRISSIWIGFSVILFIISGYRTEYNELAIYFIIFFCIYCINN